jgi:hypothetical protein
MPARTGTLTIDDLLATTHQSAADFGLDNIAQVLQADLETHNQLVEEMLSSLADITTDRQRIYGVSSDGTMYKVDEFGRAPTQKPPKGSEVAFPMHLFQHAIGWTDTYFQNHTPADMARVQIAAEVAHQKAIQQELKEAIFRSANYTFEDHLVDRFDLPVKRFLNADGFPIPNGPNGEVFDGATHTHYNANASLTAAAVLALINDVIEHGHGEDLMLCIAKGNETAFRALDGFLPYTDPRVILGTHANQAANVLDTSRTNNRAIGIFDAAEVWVKPWVPTNYMFCYAQGDARKGLAFRQRSATSLQGLRLAATIGSFPLHTEYQVAEFGIGAWERTNGAVLFFADGTYADPF